MSEADIIAIIKWGPVVLLLLALLHGMLVGLIKGRRKALRRTIYVVLFVGGIYAFLPQITDFLMNLQIGDFQMRATIEGFVKDNKSLQEISSAIPALEQLIVQYPDALVSLVLFMITVLLILPLSFPIYWIYLIFYSIIEKLVFKYSKFKRDENGKILRNEKGKKIKDKKNKHRHTGAIIMGVQYCALSSVIFAPVGVITRLYKDGKDASVSKDLSSIEFLKEYKDILNYVDVFNDSIVGKIVNSQLSEAIIGYITPIEVNGNKSTLENELSNVVVAAVYLQDSGVLDLILKGNIDFKNLDLSQLNLAKIDEMINTLFESVTLDAIIGDGVNYVLEKPLKEVLTKYSSDADIVSKLKYSNSQEVKEELLRVSEIIRVAINSKLLELYQKNNNNVIGMVNEVSTSTVETLLNKILSIKILNKAMPSVVNKLLKDEGLSQELAEINSNELVSMVIDVLNLAKSLEVTHLDDLLKGNVMDNLVANLYENGAIKTNTKEALATFLARVSSSEFSDVLAHQLNKILTKFEITLNGKMLMNVTTKEGWLQELAVLEGVFELYKGYKNENKVDFLVATELLEDLKTTKAMILAFPIAYQKLFPTIGIEVDVNKIKYIDYNAENVEEQERDFYQYWVGQLEHLDVISEELAKLNISSISDVSLDLLDLKANVVSLSKILGEVFTSDLLKDGTSKLLSDTLKKAIAEYEVTLPDNSIQNVNSKSEVNPYYIIVDSKEVEVSFASDKYYVLGEEVTIENDLVTYQGEIYELYENTIAKVWERELINLSDIVGVVKTGNFTEKTNLKIMLDSLDSMYLLEHCKTDLLMFAVKKTGLLPTDDFNSIDKNSLSFSKEKTILLNVIEKHELLESISSIDFTTISDEKIEDLSYVLDNVLDSDIFADYAAKNIVNIAANADITLDKATVLNASSWQEDLTLMRTALNMNSDSFNKTTMESLLTGIEESTLLGDIKNDLLLDTAKKISITGVSIPSTLTSDELVYADEKNAILVASDNLTLLEDISGSEFSLSSVDSDKISELLAATLKSKMFSTSVIDSLVTVFNNNDIKNDLDTTNNDSLVASIKLLDTKEKWKSEIDLIKGLLEIDTKEEVSETLFTNIENSTLLGGCKANLLLRMINEINKNQPDLDLDTTITVTDLTANDYAQYKLEKQVLINLVSIEGVNMDTINTSTKGTVATLLNNLKESEVFKNVYGDVVSDITTSMSDNEDLSDWGIVVNTNPVITDWNVELTALLTIKDNAASINAMDLETLDTTIVGNALDEMDKSKIIGGSANAANAIVAGITGVEDATITKADNETWTQAFDRQFGE